MEDVKMPETLTKKQAVKILQSFEKVTPKQKDCILAGINALLSCPSCLGVGLFWTDIKPGGAHRTKRAVNGKMQYSHNCPLCVGTGNFIEIKCNSCGKVEDVLCGKRNLFHCLKCHESLERKGYL